MIRKYWPHALIALILLLGIVGVLQSSTNFRYCINNQGQYPAPQYKNNQATAVLVPASSNGGVVLSCIGGFANENGAGITALATVLLMFITAGLAWISRQQYITTRAQLRAYLLPVSVGIFDGTTVIPPMAAFAGFPLTHLMMRNSGQTPAYNVVSHIGIALIPVTDEDRLLVIPSLQPDIEFSVGAGAEIPRTWKYGRALTPAEITGISVNPPTHAIYIYGRCEYKDTFRQRHFSDFRYFYSGSWPPAPGVLLNVCKKGNNSN